MNTNISAPGPRQHASKRPLRTSLGDLIAPRLFGPEGLQTLVRQVADRKRAAQAAAVAARATRASWERAFEAHLATVAAQLGVSVADPDCRELAAETFGQR